MCHGFEKTGGWAFLGLGGKENPPKKKDKHPPISL